MTNPLTQPFSKNNGIPPFDKIETIHYKQAIECGINKQLKEINAIIDLKDKPNFENTILAIENSGEILKQASSVLFNLSYACTNDSLQKTIMELAPLLSTHNDKIYLNSKLFKKVQLVWKNRKKFNLKGQKLRLLELFYKTFIRNGSNLNKIDKKRITTINKRLSILSLTFGKNILDSINEYKLVVDDINELSGLPNDIINAARESAQSLDLENKWLFTLHNSSLMPLLQYADDRKLRHKIWSTYVNLGNLDDNLDNKSIIMEIVNLRIEKAKILGFKNHGHYVLDEQMAKSPENVNELLHKLWKPALKMAQNEASDLLQIIKNEGKRHKLEPWDWRYYAEKLRKKNFNIDENEIKPYFKLENVQNGIFEVVNRLYGLQFIERNDLPVYQEDVKAFEVIENQNKTIGYLYVDYFPRENKQGGAWMTSYIAQKVKGKKRICPVISIVCNFTKPQADLPSLLTFDEVNTFFHEFGHAIHGLLSDVKYESLAGTNVPTDFVELPSQIFENWATEPEVLKIYARNFKTGKIIPDEIVKKIKASSRLGQGFATVEYLSASILDMAYHTLTENIESDIPTFEKEVFEKIGLLPQITSRYRSTYFRHVFSGGYSSGYYSYIWSEVLDSDAFSFFRTKGIFNETIALKFRKNILEKGGSSDPMKLYIKFRGKKPEINHLLEKRGLIVN